MGRKRAELPENWKETAISLMTEGAHMTKVLKELGISRTTHYGLCDSNDEYRETIEQGKLLSEAWWTEQGRENVKNKNFNNTLFIFMMKAVFKWKDNHGQAKDDNDLPSEEENRAIRDKFRNKDLSESIQ